MNWVQCMLNSIDSIRQKIDNCVIAENVLTVLHLQWKLIVQGIAKGKCKCFENFAIDLNSIYVNMRLG